MALCRRSNDTVVTSAGTAPFVHAQKLFFTAFCANSPSTGNAVATT
jgi:hypothetical protein